MHETWAVAIGFFVKVTKIVNPTQEQRILPLCPLSHDPRAEGKTRWPVVVDVVAVAVIRSDQIGIL